MIYECPICGKRYSSAGARNLHYEKVCGKDRPTYTVNLKERLAPYVIPNEQPDPLERPELIAPWEEPEELESPDYWQDLIDTKLRLIAAIIDRNGVSPTVKEEALSEIARIRELLR